MAKTFTVMLTTNRWDNITCMASFSVSADTVQSAVAQASREFSEYFELPKGADGKFLSTPEVISVSK